MKVEAIGMSEVLGVFEWLSHMMRFNHTGWVVFYWVVTISNLPNCNNGYDMLQVFKTCGCGCPAFWLLAGETSARCHVSGPVSLKFDDVYQLCPSSASDVKI